MPYHVIRKLPTIDEIVSTFPLSPKNATKIAQDRNEVKQILAGKDHRLIFIVGPCSAWPYDAVLDYAERLQQLNLLVKKNLKIIMRVYIQKPRTTKGWMGMLTQPDPTAKPNIANGLLLARKMMLKVIEMGLPIADEAVYTQNAKGFVDLLTWVAIGARSSENPIHRMFASYLNCPVGLKNPTHGSLDIAINSLVAAQHPHVMALDGYEIQTLGNPYAHLVLRGSNLGPNYSNKHLLRIQELIHAHGIQNSSVIIDASHDNSQVNGKKNHQQQITTVSTVIENIASIPSLKSLVKGFMIESFIKPGNQTIDAKLRDEIDMDGLSITDPCLGWSETEDLILSINELVYHG